MAARFNAAEDGHGLYPVNEVVQGVPALFEGRDPVKHQILSALANSCYGVPLCMEAGGKQDCIGYALPTSNDVDEVVMYFDDGQIFALYPDNEDAHRRLLFQRLFYPRQLPIIANIEDMKIVDAIGTLLSDLPHDAGRCLTNAIKAHTAEVNAASRRALADPAGLKRQRERLIRQTSAAAFRKLGRLAGVVYKGG